MCRWISFRAKSGRIELDLLGDHLPARDQSGSFIAITPSRTVAICGH